MKLAGIKAWQISTIGMKPLVESFNGLGLGSHRDFGSTHEWPKRLLLYPNIFSFMKPGHVQWCILYSSTYLPPMTPYLEEV